MTMLQRSQKVASVKRKIAEMRARRSTAPVLEMVAPPAPEAGPASYTMRVGGKVYEVASLADASRMFCAARDAHGEGASRTPTPVVLRNGVEWGHVSYNGKVWSCLPGEWMPDDAPVFNPYA
jgi:hypothetical protein